MAKRDTFQPIHPLAMAEAITEVAARATYLMAEVQTTVDLMDIMSHDKLKAQVKKIATAADSLRAAMYPEEAY